MSSVKFHQVDDINNVCHFLPSTEEEAGMDEEAQTLAILELWSDSGDECPLALEDSVSRQPEEKPENWNKSDAIGILIVTKFVFVLWFLMSLWISWYFSFLAFLPRASFGSFDVEESVLSLTGGFVLSVVFFQLLSILFSFFASKAYYLYVQLAFLLYWVWFGVMLGVGEMRIVSPFHGMLAGISRCLLASSFFLWFDRYFRAPYLWGFHAIATGLGSCLGLLEICPTNVMQNIVIVGGFSLGAIIVQLGWCGFSGHWKKLEKTLYWFSIIENVILSRSFWAIAGYSVFCTGPFLSVAYWWCPVYLSDVYNLSDWRNNEIVVYLWFGVVCGSALISLFFFVYRLTKWVAFAAGVIAFLSSLCIAVVPAAKMSTRVLVIFLFLLGFSSGSCEVSVYPLISKHLQINESIFVLPFITALTVFSSLVYHLMSYWLLSAYSSQATSSPVAKRWNVYQFSVWLVCAISFFIASFVIFWLEDAVSVPRRESSSDSSKSMELKEADHIERCDDFE